MTLNNAIKRIVSNKNILVTGGTGTIGSEIVRQLLPYKPKALRILSRDEHKQFILQEELQHYKFIRYLIGDVRDKERLVKAMENIDVVFHAAALKHVPSCEFNPFEAIKTNVLGSQNIIDAGLKNKVSHIVAISTDKAASPLSTMGATKLLAEKLINSAHYYKGNNPAKICCVRFGNVLGSRGSLIPIVKHAVKNGNTVKITHPNMKRFMMTIPDAVSLVFKALTITKGGETFILKMPVLEIIDLIEVLIEIFSKKYNVDPKTIKKQTIGMRPGEKLYEDLMTEMEADNALETKDMFILLSSIDIPNRRQIKLSYKNAVKTKLVRYSSEFEKAISKAKIKTLLKNAKVE